MKKLKDWSPYKIYFDIFAKIGLDRTVNIRFGPKFEALIQKHIDYLKEIDKKTGNLNDPSE